MNGTKPSALMIGSLALDCLDQISPRSFKQYGYYRGNTIGPQKTAKNGRNVLPW